MKELAYSIKILGTDTQVRNIDEIKKALKEATEVANKSDFGTAAYNNANNVVNQLKGELALLNKEATQQRKIFESLKFPEGSYRETQLQAASLTETLRQQVRGVTVTNEAYDEIEKKLIGLKTQLADFDRKLTPGGTLVGEYARGIKQAFDELGATNFFAKIEAGVTQGTGAVKGSVAAIEAELNELKNIQKTYTEQGSAEFKMLQDRIEELSGSVREYKMDLKDAAKLNEGFDKAAAGLAKVSAGFLSAFGAAKTFIGAEEDAQKALAETAKYIQYVQAVSEASDTIKQAGILNGIFLRKLEAASINLGTIAESKNIVVKYAAAKAQQFLNATLAAGPWAPILLLIGAAVAAYSAYKAVVNDVTDAERKRQIGIKLTAELQSQTSKEAAKELATLEKLKVAITDSSASMKLRIDALKQYNEIASDANKIEVTQIENSSKIDEAFKRQTSLILKRAEARAIENGYAEAYEELLNTELKFKDSSKNAAKDVSAGVGDISNLSKAAVTFFKTFSIEQTKLTAQGLEGISKTAEEYRTVNEKLDFYKNKLIEAQRANEDLYEKKNSGGKDSSEKQKANIDSEIQATIKAGEVILEIQKRRLQRSLEDLKEGREKEVREAEVKFEDLKSITSKELRAIDKLLDENRKKQEELMSNDKLDPKDKAVKFKELTSLYDKLFRDRTNANTEANKLISEEEERLRQEILSINEKYNQRELLDKLVNIDEATKAEILAADEVRAGKSIAAMKSIKDKTELKKQELKIEEEYNTKEFEAKKKSIEQKAALLLVEINAVKSSADELTASLDEFYSTPETDEEKKRKEELLKQYKELTAELAKLEEARTKKQGEEASKRKGIDDEETKNKISAVNSVFDVVSNIGSSTNNIVSQFAQREMSTFDEKINYQKDRLSDLESKVASTSGATQRIYQKQLEAEKASLEKTEAEKEKTRKKYAKIKKGIDITLAIIDAAKSAIAAYSAYAGIPIVGPVLGAVAAAAAAAFGAVQVGLIASTPLAKGGNLNGDISNVNNGHIPSGAGVITGDTHSSPSGGVGFNYKGKAFKAEAGEIKVNNGKERFIFTKKVFSDPVLRAIAMATHNNQGHPMARMVGSMVNMYAGGRSFGGGSGYMAMGGSLDAVMGKALESPVIVTAHSTDPAIIDLIKDVNEQSKMIAGKLEERISAVERMKIAVPVDKVSEIQDNEKKVRSTGLF
jgi:hypothetical protein